MTENTAKFKKLTTDKEKLEMWPKVLEALSRLEHGYQYDIKFCQRVIKKITDNVGKDESPLFVDTSSPVSESVMKIAFSCAFSASSMPSVAV